MNGGQAMAFEESNSGCRVPSTKRERKGRSLIAFPPEYCMVDIETTGLSTVWNDIIEIGAIRYSNGQETGRFQTLVQPQAQYNRNGVLYYVDSFIEELTGITNEMLATAPSARDAIHDFAEFLGDSVILGYNVNFDVNFLYDQFQNCLGRPLTNDFVDIMRMARKLYPDMPHHRLKDMLAMYGLTNDKEHRTITDCEATQRCYERIHQEAVSQYGNDASFCRCFDNFRNYGGSFQRYYKYPNAADFHGDETQFRPDCPLYQQRCVITGTLDRFTRAEAYQLIVDLGGIVENGVTKKTDFLILGNNDYCASIKDGKSAKQKKAEAYILKGLDIKIIPETVFYDMIADNIEDKPEE